MTKVAFKNSNLELIRRWPTSKARLWVEDYLWRASYDPKILAVVAVGSSVRDGVSSNDLDLVTIVKGSAENGLERPPIEIDLRVYSFEDLELKIVNGNDYLGWAIKFGRVLYERENFWSLLFEKLGTKIPLPSPSVARDRANVALKHATALLETGDQDAALEQIISVLTHLGRAELIEAGIYPASRPEIPAQLEKAGKSPEGALLRRAIEHVASPSILLEAVHRVFHV